MFESNFLCLNCDRQWEDHETVWESEEERVRMGFAVGEAFIPLAGNGGLQGVVFGGGGGGGNAEEMFERGEISAKEYHDMIASGDNAASSVADAMVGMRVRSDVVSKGKMAPKQGKPERMVRLMHESSGGTRKGKVLNRWGKAEET